MPSSTLDDLLEAYTRVGVRNRAILDAFALIAQQFHQHGIAFIVLKGADIISRLYGVQGARPLSDVDLLVRESDIPAIDRLLRSLGFTPQIDGNPSYASSERGLALDLITTIWYLDEHSLEELWKRAPTRRVGGITISCLDTADLVIYLTAYAVVHRGELSAAFVQDMKLLIEKESPAWATVVARTKQALLQVPLYHGLHHVRKTVPIVPIPDTVLASLAPVNLRELMLAWLLSRLVTPDPLPEVGHLLLFLTQPGTTKLTWLKQRLYPSTTFLSYRYGLLGQTMPWRMRLSRWSHLTESVFLLSGRVLRRLLRPSRPRL
ncbi:MAG: nucleotidyltransferase family protein [Nitrospira sp.]|nr:nucleotidyltransferase family protein [Nitrospira sp.]